MLYEICPDECRILFNWNLMKKGYITMIQYMRVVANETQEFAVTLQAARSK